MTFKIVIVINGAQLRGVITDWGGVLTTPILTTVQAWIQADGLDWDSYRTVMRAWVDRVLAATQRGPADWAEAHHPRHLLALADCARRA